MPLVKICHELQVEEEESKSGIEVIEPFMLAAKQSTHMNLEQSKNVEELDEDEDLFGVIGKPHGVSFFSISMLF